MRMVLVPRSTFTTKMILTSINTFNWKKDFFSEVEYGANGEFLSSIMNILLILKKANYASCAPRFNMPPDFKRQPWGGYYYDEYNVVMKGLTVVV